MPVFSLLTDAVLNLPSLAHTGGAGTQIGTQNLFRAGHDVSAVDNKTTVFNDSEATDNKLLEAALAAPVMTGQDTEKSGPYRIRTYGLLIRSQPL